MWVRNCLQNLHELPKLSGYPIYSLIKCMLSLHLSRCWKRYWREYISSNSDRKIFSSCSLDRVSSLIILVSVWGHDIKWHWGCGDACEVPFILFKFKNRPARTANEKAVGIITESWNRSCIMIFNLWSDLHCFGFTILSVGEDLWVLML